MCDTLCTVLGDRVLFAKNSDREPGEAQAIEVHAARSGQRTVQCTTLSLSDVQRTSAVLLSRPTWMWGAEMGANEHGVVCGNEAVFTRLPVEPQGLTGMDLLRLGLERSTTARECAERIVELLARHPQGGPMGFRNKGFRYHSSFLMADRQAAWVLETAGRFWALERVRGARAISNGLTISQPDAVHPEAADEARRRGWLPAGATFDFAAAFGSPFYRRVTGAPQRLACTADLARAATSREDLMAALTRHQHAHPADGLRLESPCAHASWQPTRHAGQTTSSMVSELGATARHAFTGTSSPCLSLFKPVSFDSTLPPTATTQATDCLFWNHERLHRAVLTGWETRAPLARTLVQTIAHEQDLWAAHAAMLPEWLAKLRAQPASARAPAFRAWWRRQSSLDGLRA